MILTEFFIKQDDKQPKPVLNNRTVFGNIFLNILTCGLTNFTVVRFYNDCSKVTHFQCCFLVLSKTLSKGGKL